MVKTEKCARRMRSIAVVLITLTLAARTGAQEKVRLGIGVSLNPAAVAGDSSSLFQTRGMADFYFLVQVGEYFRTEVQFGLYHRTAHQTSADTSGEFDVNTTSTIVRTGFGVFITWHTDSALTLYAGPRVGVLYSSLAQDYSRTPAGLGKQSTIWAGFFWVACFGAEYALSAHFTLGGEFDLTSTGFGVPNEEYPTSGYPRDLKYNVWSTDALIFARFYF
jgi:hypothetical protein